MHIGILSCGHLPESLSARHGTYSDMFKRLFAPFGFTFTTWDVVDGVFPDGPEAAEGWLVTGSKHGANDDLPWIAPLEAFIRAAFAADRPVVGICFGHQVMAQAMGGRVEKFAGGWAVGPQNYAFVQGPRRIQAWHQDQVVDPPEAARTVASNDFCAHAALLYPGKGFSVQPHPEFDDDVVQMLITERGPGVVPDPQLRSAEAALGTPLDRTDIAARCARFFQERRIA